MPQHLKFSQLARSTNVKVREWYAQLTGLVRFFNDVANLWQRLRGTKTPLNPAPNQSSGSGTSSNRQSSKATERELKADEEL